MGQKMSWDRAERTFRHALIQMEHAFTSALAEIVVEPSEAGSQSSDADIDLGLYLYTFFLLLTCLFCPTNLLVLSY